MSGAGLHVDGGVEHRSPASTRSIGRAADKRPRLITARRSHSPNSSGRYELTIEHGLALVGRARDDLVDLRLAADVDAAGRLVEQQDVAC